MKNNYFNKNTKTNIAIIGSHQLQATSFGRHMVRRIRVGEYHCWWLVVQNRHLKVAYHSVVKIRLLLTQLYCC